MRWKRRAEAFQHGQIEEMEEKKIEAQKQLLENERVKAEELKLEKKHEHFIKNITLQYEEIEKASLNEESDSLLLPMHIESKSSQSLSSKGISINGVQRVAVESVIAEVEKDKKQAELNALIYRNYAEQLKKEKRELNDTLNRKIEIVRDFWRNKLCEGDSRGGRMVRAAYMQLHKKGQL